MDRKREVASERQGGQISVVIKVLVSQPTPFSL